ncbi:MAG: Rid family hydrolase [Acidobacteriaceae bacterium]
MKIERINPATLHAPVDNLYTHIVRAEGRYVYRIGGQVAIGLQCENLGKGDMREQLRVVYEMATRALKAVNLTWDNVIHIYTFTTDMDEYMKYEKPIAMAAFGDHPPASTLVEVRRLVDPDWLVEIQLDAVGD